METGNLEKDGYEECLRRAASYLEKGLVIAFPTETFYALGARYDRDEGLKRISRLKARPESKVFPLIIGAKEQLSALAGYIDPLAMKIIDSFWPAPLTVIMSAKESLSHYIRDERNTVAVRMPGPSFALDLARCVPFSFTATSANKKGMQPARSGEEVRAAFPEGIDLLIEGGTSTAAGPSTIIEIQGNAVKILREGVIPRTRIISILQN